MENLNDYIAVYKQQLEKGDIQKAYRGLLKCMMNLNAYLAKSLSDKFTFGNISPGYMDFTYFPFSNDFLKKQKLRFGIVLNHEKIRFELWLMGQNAEIQSKYWDALKNTKWNKNQSGMPKYSVLEAVLLDTPDFNNPEYLQKIIEKETIRLTGEIIVYLRNN